MDKRVKTKIGNYEAEFQEGGLLEGEYQISLFPHMHASARLKGQGQGLTFAYFSLLESIAF